MIGLSIADPSPKPTISLDDKVRCEHAARVINQQAKKAGEKLHATCAEIEYLEVPDGWLKNNQKSHHETRVHH